MTADSYYVCMGDGTQLHATVVENDTTISWWRWWSDYGEPFQEYAANSDYPPDWPEGAGEKVIWDTTGAKQPRLFVWDDDSTLEGCWFDRSGLGWVTVWVIRVWKLQIYSECEHMWHDVSGTINVFKGSTHEFRATRVPTEAPQWPSGQPTWSGVASGSGEEIQVSFPTEGTYQLTVKCGEHDVGITLGINVVVPASATGWSNTADGGGSNMSCSDIIQKWDAQWFHCPTEHCPLKVKNVHDYDYYNDGGGFDMDQEHDYMDPDTAKWLGPGITITTGYETMWNPEWPTGETGVTITFSVDDQTDNPTPAYPDRFVDDEGPLTRQKQMYAYEAVAYLNCTSSNNGSPTSGPIYQSGAVQACSIQLSLAESHVYADDDGEELTIDAFGTAAWRLQTSPDAANLGSGGQLRVRVGVTATGDLCGRVTDNDIVDGDVQVSVALSGGSGVSASVGVTFVVTGDTSEGAAGAGFAFSSDDLGDDTDDLLELASSAYDDWPPGSELPAEKIVAYLYAPDNQYFRGGKNGEHKAKAVIEGKAKCVEQDALDIAGAKVWSTGYVEYYVGYPWYEPGTFTQNQNW